MAIATLAEFFQPCVFICKLRFSYGMQHRPSHFKTFCSWFILLRKYGSQSGFASLLNTVIQIPIIFPRPKWTRKLTLNIYFPEHKVAGTKCLDNSTEPKPLRNNWKSSDNFGLKKKKTWTVKIPFSFFFPLPKHSSLVYFHFSLLHCSTDKFALKCKHFCSGKWHNITVKWFFYVICCDCTELDEGPTVRLLQVRTFIGQMDGKPGTLICN